MKSQKRRNSEKCQMSAMMRGMVLIFCSRFPISLQNKKGEKRKNKSEWMA